MSMTTTPMPTGTLDKRALTTCADFWALVDTVDAGGANAEAQRQALALSRYLFNHGGYYRLANSLLALAQGVAGRCEQADSEQVNLCRECPDKHFRDRIVEVWPRLDDVDGDLSAADFVEYVDAELDAYTEQTEGGCRKCERKEWVSPAFLLANGIDVGDLEPPEPPVPDDSYTHDPCGDDVPCHAGGA